MIHGPYNIKLKKCNHHAHKIFSVGETYITVVQHSHSRTVSKRIKKGVESLTSAERLNLISVVTCKNAAGKYILPLIVFPRKNMKEDLMDGAPAGSAGACHPSGCTENSLSLRQMILFC